MIPLPLATILLPAATFIIDNFEAIADKLEAHDNSLAAKALASDLTTHTNNTTTAHGINNLATSASLTSHTSNTTTAHGLDTALALKANVSHTHTLSSITDAGTAAAANTGTSSGNVPTLDGSGKLSTGVLPALAITDTFVVGSQAAMLALTVEVGDVAVRSDLNKTFILQTADPTVLGHWQELLTPTDLVSSVNGMTGAVSLTAANVSAAPTTRTISTTSPLIGGGDLSANRTLAINASSSLTNSYVVQRDSAGSFEANVVGVNRLKISGEIYLTDIDGVLVVDDGTGGPSARGSLISIAVETVEANAIAFADTVLQQYDSNTVKVADDSGEPRDFLARTLIGNTLSITGTVDVNAGVFFVSENENSIQLAAGSVSVGTNGGAIGFFGATPSAKSTGWGGLFYDPLKTWNVGDSLDTELANIVATLIEELKAKGILG